MMVSATLLTRTSGTMVAIIESARDCAGSFRERRSDSMEWEMDFQIC
jgi:hypothetical protein